MESDALQRFFGDYLSAARSGDWERAKAALPRESWAVGTVVVRHHYGVRLDLGVGFPGLLLVTRFRDKVKVRTSYPDYAAVGDQLEVRVLSFIEEAREFVLTQDEAEATFRA